MLEGTIDNYQMEKRYLHKHGPIIHILLSVSLVRDAQGRPSHFVSQVKDVTQQKNDELALAAQDALLRQFIKHSPAAIAMFDRDMRYLQMSDRWRADYNLSAQDLTGLSHYEVFPEITEEWKLIHRRVLAGAVERCDEDAFLRADGSTDWLQWECRPWLDSSGGIGGLVMYTQVITERKLIEERVKASLLEKEVLLEEIHQRVREKTSLLQEVHHRVKNNLQMISSLLNLQARQTADGATRALFLESQGRVRSIALLHESLYQSADLGRVNMQEYVSKLVSTLARTYRQAARVVTEIGPVHLPADLAVPCGLIVNELITNALKHAFPSSESVPQNEIRIEMRRLDDNLELVVADNGCGFASAVDPHRAGTMGLTLVRDLSVQLGGVATFTTANGTRCAVRFPAPKESIGS